MHRCHTCGNEYEHSFEVRQNGQSYWFDCFECAIHELAPTCSSCGVRVMGHGVQAGEEVFCCASCARRQGIQGLTDHAPPPSMEARP